MSKADRGIEDLVQQTFSACLESAPRFRGESAAGFRKAPCGVGFRATRDDLDRWSAELRARTQSAGA